jgi:hypothetical protein
MRFDESAGQRKTPLGTSGLGTGRADAPETGRIAAGAQTAVGHESASVVDSCRLYRADIYGKLRNYLR